MCFCEEAKYRKGNGRYCVAEQLDSYWPNKSCEQQERFYEQQRSIFSIRASSENNPTTIMTFLFRITDLESLQPP